MEPLILGIIGVGGSVVFLLGREAIIESAKKINDVKAMALQMEQSRKNDVKAMALQMEQSRKKEIQGLQEVIAILMENQSNENYLDIFAERDEAKKLYREKREEHRKEVWDLERRLTQTGCRHKPTCKWIKAHSKESPVELKVH
jgi:hypothetical protein